MQPRERRARFFRELVVIRFAGRSLIEHVKKAPGMTALFEFADPVVVGPNWVVGQLPCR